MDTSAIKRWTILGVVGVAAVYGAYWYSARSNTPELAAIASSGCNMPSTLANLTLPIDLLNTTSAGLAVTFGPIEAGGVSAPFHLVFDPAVDGTLREVSMTGGSLHLPVVFGRGAAVPERITLTCRDNTVATVRYSSGRTAASTFNVVQTDPVQAMPANEATSEATSEAGG